MIFGKRWNQKSEIKEWAVFFLRDSGFVQHANQADKKTRLVFLIWGNFQAFFCGLSAGRYERSILNENLLI